MPKEQNIQIIKSTITTTYFNAAINMEGKNKDGSKIT